MSRKTKRKPRKIDCVEILGEHPPEEHPFGSLLSASDTHTKTGVPHRDLVEIDDDQNAMVTYIRELLIKHHVSPEALERDKRRREAMKRLGFEADQDRMKRFPTNPLTQKGNLAEVVLAEYLDSSASVNLPIYRLRYNPNIDQAMKGDDVLAFDLDSDPVRIIVGESKFRSTSSKSDVVEIVKGLTRSYVGGVPSSLMFVADRLFETGEIALGERVMECAILFSLDKLRLDYVGLLMSDARSAKRLFLHTDKSLRRLAVISFSMDSPGSIVDPCYNDLNEQL